MLNNVTHDAGAVEAFRGHIHSNISLHLALGTQLLKLVLLRLQFALVLEGRLWHVGKQVAKLDVVSPGSLVTTSIQHYIPNTHTHTYT